MQLRTFLMVLETGSFSAAALELGGAQSGVSYAVAELERELGVQLLERGRFGARPTETGARVARYSRQMLGLEAAIRQEVALVHGPLQGTLRVATFRSVASHILPTVVAQLARLYPALTVELLELDDAGLEQSLPEGRAEVAFLQEPYPKEVFAWDLLRDPYVALLPKTHPWASRALSRRDLMALPLPLVLYRDPKCGRIIQNYLEGAPLGYPLTQRSYKLREDSTIFRMVEQGLGVSIVPELAFRDLPDSVARVTLTEPLERTIGVAISPVSFKIPAVRAFLGVLKSQFPESLLPRLELLSPALPSEELVLEE